MKKFSILICYFIIFYKNQAQVVFCPPGAEWHYSFSRGFPSQNNFYNEKIYYRSDTVINSQTFKVLKHSMALWSDCADNANITLIKQAGDTVFFRNRLTQHQWQILYNFAALAGQSWTNTLAYGSSSLNYTVLVDAVGTIQLNGTNLKQLVVKYNGVPSLIHERLGSNQFLFNFYYPNCDSYYFQQRLCYKDNSFQEIQFTNLSCDYNTTEILERLSFDKKFKIFPNPANDIVTIELESNNEQNYHIHLIDMLGKVKFSLDQLSANQKTLILNMKSFEKGIYFIQVYHHAQIVAIEKIFKN